VTGLATEEEGLAELGDWLCARRELVAGQVTVEEKGDGMTVVKIDHRLSCELPTHAAGWHISTRRTFLPRSHFTSYATAKVNHAAGSGRGRALYCHDPLSREVTAALAYHLDSRPQMPVLITALAFRDDTEGSAVARERTVAAGLVLKHHLHAIAEEVGRGGHVDIDLPDRDDQLEIARAYGFKTAPKVPGFRPSAIHLRQPAPV
jgi:hypothetical protein